MCIWERIKESPLVVPLVLEHLWRHCSSRQVWEAIQAKGEAALVRQAKGPVAKALRKEGAALKLPQSQWDGLMDYFNEAFLEPVVFWPFGLLRNSPLVTFTLRKDSDDGAVEFAQRVSEQSIVTAVMPEPGPGGLVRIWCNPPSDRQASVLRLVGEFHRGEKPPTVGIVDIAATRGAMQPAFCGFDWTSFDPDTFSWGFNGESHLERLKGIGTSSGPKRVLDKAADTK